MLGDSPYLLLCVAFKCHAFGWILLRTWYLHTLSLAYTWSLWSKQIKTKLWLVSCEAVPFKLKIEPSSSHARRRRSKIPARTRPYWMHCCYLDVHEPCNLLDILYGRPSQVLSVFSSRGTISTGRTNLKTTGWKLEMLLPTRATILSRCRVVLEQSTIRYSQQAIRI
jgi:hypothetical protein